MTNCKNILFQLCDKIGSKKTVAIKTTANAMAIKTINSYIKLRKIFRFNFISALKIYKLNTSTHLKINAKFLTHSLQLEILTIKLQE